MGHFVNSPLVITKAENGSDLYLYFGAPVPSHVKDDELDRLKSEGFIKSDSDEPDEAPAKPASK